jgi:peroxiredoxin
LKINSLSLALAILPAFSAASTHPDPAVVTKAESLLAHSDETLANARTLEAHYTQIDAYPGKYRDLRQEGTVIVERPDELRVEVVRARRVQASDPWKDTGNNTLAVVSPQGRFDVFLHPHSTQVRKDSSTSPSLADVPALNGFFSGKNTPAAILSKAASEGTLEDVKVDGSEVHYSIGKTERTIQIGSDGLVHRFEIRTLGSGETRTWVLDSVSLDKRVAETNFQYTPPADAIPYDRAAPGDGLEIGSTAPDFELPDVNGKLVHLSDLRGKVVLVKFWATWCWPCNQSLPETEALSAAYEGQGVETVAVSIKDSKAGLAAWVKKHPAYSHIHFTFEDPNHPSVSSAYQIRTTPSVYVIGKDGTIVAEIDGFTGPNPALEKAIKAAL